MGRTYAMLGVGDDVPAALPAADRTVLGAAAGQALLTLRQQRSVLEAAEAKRQAATTELRTALLSAVGHDLRAPDITLSTEDKEELETTIEGSADRLTALVNNLLDSSRLATGAVEPRLRPVGYDEIVARALSGLDGQARVSVGGNEHLPAVLADEGLPKKIIDQVFVPFQRLGDRDNTSGVGLGLSVAKGFVDAMGGSIRAEDTPGGCLTLVIALPTALGGRS